MNYLALSGNMHPLTRYLDPERVTFLDAPTWGRASWSRRHAMRVAESITEPTVLIGFSAGATAAVEIASVNCMIEKVFAHSPEFVGYATPRCWVTLFQTKGDTTPTYEETGQTVERWKSRMFYSFKFHEDLPPVAAEPVRDLATWTMARKGHQFRNCLPFLPREILR